MQNRSSARKPGSETASKYFAQASSGEEQQSDLSDNDRQDSNEGSGSERGNQPESESGSEYGDSESEGVGELDSEGAGELDSDGGDEGLSEPASERPTRQPTRRKRSHDTADVFTLTTKPTTPEQPPSKKTKRGGQPSEDAISQPDNFQSTLTTDIARRLFSIKDKHRRKAWCKVLQEYNFGLASNKQATEKELKDAWKPIQEAEKKFLPKSKMGLSEEDQGLLLFGNEKRSWDRITKKFNHRFRKGDSRMSQQEVMQRYSELTGKTAYNIPQTEQAGDDEEQASDKEPAAEKAQEDQEENETASSVARITLVEGTVRSGAPAPRRQTSNG